MKNVKARPFEKDFIIWVDILLKWFIFQKLIHIRSTYPKPKGHSATNVAGAFRAIGWLPTMPGQ